MKRAKLITAVSLGTIIALIVIPKTRRMLAGAVEHISDSLKDAITSAGDILQKGKKEINQVSDTAKDTASSVWNTKAAWNA